MYVATIIDMDDTEPYCVIGPFMTADEAGQEGDRMAEFLNARTMPGHAHPHDWESWIDEVKTPNEVIIGIERGY